MDKNKRKYPIHSTVRIPDMDEIINAASDFEEEAMMEAADPSVRKSAKFPTVDTKPQFDAELSSIKKEMQKLAVVIANEELSKEVVASDPDIPAVESPEQADDDVINQADSSPSDVSNKKEADANNTNKKTPRKK